MKREAAVLQTEEEALEQLREWFGPLWTWNEIALWIEARSADPAIPAAAAVWSSEYLEQRRQQDSADW